MPMTDELKQSLEDKFRKEDCYSQRIPMIIISQTKDLVLPFVTGKEEEILADADASLINISKRKYIEIDD